MCKLMWLVCVKLYVSRTLVFSRSLVGSLTTPQGAATPTLRNDALKYIQSSNEQTSDSAISIF
jgi:hypothetical protein